VRAALRAPGRVSGHNGSVALSPHCPPRSPSLLNLTGTPLTQRTDTRRTRESRPGRDTFWESHGAHGAHGARLGAQRRDAVRRITPRPPRYLRARAEVRRHAVWRRCCARVMARLAQRCSWRLRPACCRYVLLSGPACVVPCACIRKQPCVWVLWDRNRSLARFPRAPAQALRAQAPATKPAAPYEPPCGKNNMCNMPRQCYVCTDAEYEVAANGYGQGIPARSAPNSLASPILGGSGGVHVEIWKVQSDGHLRLGVVLIAPHPGSRLTFPHAYRRVSRNCAVQRTGGKLPLLLEAG
jgi:hypothetical protein